MVQSLFFFLLGVFASSFIVVLFAPAVLRRTERLTRRRLEATLPLTSVEIQAEKDGVRAEFAVATRRLEMEIKALREKTAQQLVEIGRRDEALREAKQRQEEGEKALAEAERRNSELQSELAQRESQLQQVAQSLASAEKTIEAHVRELEKLGQMYDEASFSSSRRQIELVARESELEQVKRDLAAQRAQRKDAEKQRLDAVTESASVQESLRAEKKKTADLEKKVERLMATLADREEKLERRERELKQLREKQKASSAKLRNGATGPQPGDKAMREEMQRLAAQVVDLVIRLEGPDSPAAKALATSDDAAQPGAAPVSLAERVKALQSRVNASD